MVVEYSFVLPCRNEEKSIGKCIDQIKKTIEKNKLNAEIIVSDSSIDNSPNIAKSKDINLVLHTDKGYGIAIQNGVKKASGEYIIIGDCDGTYDFAETPKLISKINEGYNFVIGSRLKGEIKKGAMPWHHKHIGNPLLSFLLNLFFKTKISDTHSGFRIIKKSILEKLDLKTSGMEYASEMIIKAAKNKIEIGEISISYSVRKGKSKLKSFGDGWRHLRFMLMFSPTYLFFIPGFIITLIGLILGILLSFGTIYSNNTDLGLYFALISSFLSILGFQLISLGLFSRIYALHSGFEKQDKLIDNIAKTFPLERGIFIGILLVIFAIFNVIYYKRLQNFLISMTIIIIGIQTVFSVFFISMMLVEISQEK